MLRLETDGTAEIASRDAVETDLLRRRRRFDKIIALLDLPALLAAFFVGIFLMSAAASPFWEEAALAAVALGFDDASFRNVGLGIAIAILSAFAFLVYVRSRVSNELARLVLRSDVPEGSFILYLRSFFVDEVLRALPSRIFQGIEPDNLQDRIGKTVNGGTTVAKIGARTFFDFAGGTIKTNDLSWFSDFKKLAERAQLIVMTPIVVNPRSGTARELREIAKCGWEHKTVFIAPHNRGPWIPWGRLRIRPRIRDLWNRSRSITHRLTGLTLPHYRGTALILYDRGEWTSVAGVAGRLWEHPKALAYLLDPATRAPTTHYCAMRIANRLVLIHLILLPTLIGLLAQQLATANGLEMNDAVSFFAGGVGATLLLTYPYFNFCRRFTVTDLDSFRLYAVSIASTLPCFYFAQSSRHANALLAQFKAALGDVPDTVWTAILLTTVWGALWIVTFASAYLTLKTCRPTPRWNSRGRRAETLTSIPLVRGGEPPMVARTAV